ncbi:hypothetical protein CRENBAI_013805 [Crenichthys baileyi]|uniref:Uncharacterized protein n=1 Tax=Crenichthys baileyi TaxID=28760 RepID=A0AAV9SI08_9TELE
MHAFKFLPTAIKLQKNASSFSNANASLSNANASLSNANASLSNAIASFSNANASLSNANASLSNANATLSNAMLANTSKTLHLTCLLMVVRGLGGGLTSGSLTSVSVPLGSCGYNVARQCVNVCMNGSSVAEGDSYEEDDDGDVILENDCLPAYKAHPITNSNTLNRDSPCKGQQSSIPQSVSMPNSLATSLSHSSTMMSHHYGGSTHSVGSSQESMKEDGNMITL